MSYFDKINIIENVLVRLIKYTHYFNSSNGHEGEFWPVVQNSLGESICLFWCHVFGNDKDDHHFKSFFNEETVKIAGEEFSQDSVRERLLSFLDMSPSTYKCFWQEVYDCRNKFIAHKEAGALVTFPRVDVCRSQAEEMRRVLADFSASAYKNNPESDWDFWDSYYKGQFLGSNQFSRSCENEFSEGVLNLATELTSKGTERERSQRK